MKPILFIVTFTVAVSAQNNWQQSRDHLRRNVQLSPLVQNPSYVSQNPINQNQRIGAINFAQPTGLENVFNPNQNQIITAANTWVPPTRLKNIHNPTNPNHGTPPNWNQAGNQNNPVNQQSGGYIAQQQQFIIPVNTQRRYSTVTTQPVSITYSPLQQQNVPKYQQKKHQSYKKPELKKKYIPKYPLYQPQVVYDPFAQNSNQQIQPLPYIPLEPQKQSYQSNPLNQAQRANNHQRQSYPINTVIYPSTKKHVGRPRTQATQPSVRSSKVINHVPKEPKNQRGKDYRDDRTHEPQADDVHYERDEQEFDREEAEGEPAHEEYEVPTKPIYPGEGQWAIRGKKHRPFIRGDKPVDLEEDDEVPDGYETFVQGQKVFEKTKADLSQQFDHVPKKHGLGKYLPERIEEDDDAKEDQFVPVRLYAQVRHSEDEKHLPRSAADDERLKELIKDSKIHTVYSEEGYEDDAYDHAGHNKNAETGEAFEEASRLNDRKIVKKIPDKVLEHIKKIGDDEDANSSDSSSSASQDTKNPSNDTVKNDYLSRKQSKVMTSKEANDRSVKMEVEGEVKVVMKPENATKVKQYSKSLPKVHKTLKPKHDSEGKASLIEEKVLRKKTGKVRPTSDSLPRTTATTEDIGEILTEDIPATTLGTTAIPKRRNEVKVATILTLGKEEQPFLEIAHRKRRKRGAFDGQKYPYYRANTLNPNSPLRYSEDLRNIPDKTRDDLAFYRQAETRFRCPEIDRSVDPIPDKVKDKVANGGQEEEEEEEDEDESDPSNHKPPSKRLNQLGDKIDCLKVQYFGINPLDSPFFSEPEVGPVKPVLNFNDKLGMSVSSPPTAFPKEPYIKEQLRHLPAIATILPTEYQGEPYTNEKLREQYVKQQLKHFPLVILPTAVPKEQYTEEQLKDLRDQYSKEQLEQLQEEYLKAELNKLNVPYMKEKFDRTESPYVTKQSNQYDSPYRREHAEKNTKAKSEPKASRTSANTISLRKVKINPKVALHSTSENIYNDDETIEENEMFSASEPRQNVIQIGAKKDRASTKDFSIKKQNSIETTTESVSLLTTPKYTIDLKPKHIYHQIELLGYLPGEGDTNQNATSRMDKVVEHPDEPKTNESVRVVITLDENKRKPKIFIEEVAPQFSMAGGSDDVGRAQAVRRIRIKQKRPSSSRDHAPKHVPSRIVIPLHGSESTEPTGYRPSLPYSLPYTTQRPYVGSNPYSSNYQQASIQDRIKVRIVRPTFQIFDINKFLPTTEAPLFGSLDMYGEGSGPLPKYKIVSEVYYKDDIKPNEQLMLLADVMNHIRNSSRQQIEDSSTDSSDTIPVTLKNISGNKAITQQVDRGFYEVGTTSATSTSTSTTTTVNPVRKDIDEAYVKRPRIRRVKYRKKKLRPTTPTATTTKLPEESTEVASTTEVVDLKPPAMKTYNSNKMNKYYVQGMRPPPRQKLFMYSDYLKNELNKNRQRPHRSKRSAAKYAELSRSRVGGAATTSQPDSDDYVPNRTRNWHYDDKTGNIVYHNVPKPEEDKEVEIIYEEVTEPVIPLETEKPKQNPIFATATPPPEGQSYIDFVKKLKSASSYKFIPDPTTTEKSHSTENVSSSTLKPLSTTPPEFLSILSKVKSNSEYKLIEDDKDKKTTTTTEAPEPESSESQEESVQNSPGGIGINSFQIFDITDYIPKIKHYLPATGVDTSKYTTIKRPKIDTPKADQGRSEKKSKDVVEELDRVDSHVTAEKDSSTETIPTSVDRAVISTSTTTVAITTAIPTPVPANVIPDSAQIIDVVESTTGSSDSSRRRRRRKRRRKIIGQGNSSTSLPTQSQEDVSSGASQLSNRRRRVQVSTEKFIFDNVDDVTKSVVRRSDNSDTRFQRLYEIEPSASKVESKREDFSPRKDETNKENMYVVILQPYDTNAKTGGNYMGELLTGEAATERPSQELNRKPVEVFQPYDPNQKTGGNYKAAPASNITGSTTTSPNSRKYVEVFQQYDPEKKTVGNYRDVNSYNIQKTVLPEIADGPKKYVEVFQQYDPNIKTGGNYKSIDKEKLVIENTTELVVEVTQPIGSSQNTEKNVAEGKVKEKQELPSEDDVKRNIDIFQPYNPNKKHGGNYRHDTNKTELSSASDTNAEELETLDEPIAAENQHSVPKKYREAVASTVTGIKSTTERPLVIDLLRNFDKTEELTDRTFDLKNKKRKYKKTTKSKDSVTRLADVVPKPESYYTDPNLPKAVNMLMEVNLPNEEIERIVEDKDSSEETAPKKHPTKAELSRAKVSRKLYKKAEERLPTTTTVKPDGYQVIEVTTVEDEEGKDQFEERKEAEESRTVTEKQRIDDRQDRIEPDVEETDAEEPYEEVHHSPGTANETKTSFTEEYTPLDDDHDHEDEIEGASEDEEISATGRLKNLPPIIKDPSKRLYYYLPV